MATETQEGVFGHISRTKGIVFKYGLLAATLFGIVSLAVLLAYVLLDALQPDTADPAWYLVYFLTFVAPAIGTALYFRRNDPDAGAVGRNTLGIFLGGLFLGSGASILLIDVVPPLTYLGIAAAVAVTGLVLALHARVRASAPAGERLFLGLAVLGYSLIGLPGTFMSVIDIVQSLPTVPTPRAILLVTFALPAVFLLSRDVRATTDSKRTGRAVGGGVFALVAVMSVLATSLAGAGSVESVVLPTVLAAPLAAYGTGVVAHHPERKSGFLLPVVVVGGALLGAFVVQQTGITGPASWLDWQFLTSPHSNTATDAGVYPALVGSILLMLTVAFLSFPIGVGAAVYLEEYAPNNRYTRIIQVNISNLAGVPSVVYGLLGLGLFINTFGMETGSLIVAGATLSLLILPIVIISAQEAIRSVPSSLRDASYGMGATRWQTVRNVVLPQAFPAILTGTILALGRAIGETAPLIMIAAPSVVRAVPTALNAKVSALPLQVYGWATLFASPEFYTTALAAGVVTLLVLMLVMNSIAIILRNKYQTRT